MTEQEMELCRQAAKALKLRDILLYSDEFRRGGGISQNAVQQSRNEVRFQRAKIKENDEEKNILHIIVLLGTRLMDQENEESEDDVHLHFQIEADFLVEYEIMGDLPDDAAKAFASYNAVHNVWPFWRQHVYDIIGRARLPHLDIPLFSGQKS